MPILLELYQEDVSPNFLLKTIFFFSACSSVSPTEANGGYVKTTLAVAI